MPIEKIRSTILNPSQLSNERQIQVCEQCHLETTSSLLPDRVRHYDQEPFGYHVDQPLSAFNAYFTRDPAHGRTDNVEIDSSAFRLRQSKCYIASKGALTCERCHDPHDLHKGPASAQYFANICMSCHADRVRAMVAAHQHPDSNQCVTCHMPQRRTEDVVHVIMTDHLIQRYAPNPKDALAPRKEDTGRYLGPVLRYRLDGEAPRSDDALYDAVAQVIDKSNVEQGAPKLEQLLAEKHPSEPNFYTELGDAQHELKQIDAAIISYRKALQLDPASSRAQRRLGVALGSTGQTDEALKVLTSAIARHPQNEYLPYERAQIELHTGDTAVAEADLRKTLALSPDDADALNNLGSLLARNGDTTGAEKELRSALAVDPYNSDARANLGRLLLSKGAADEALFQLRKAAELAPNAPKILLDEAVALLSTNHTAEAKTQIEHALTSSPRDARAFDLLGQIALMNRNPREARVQFQAALQADPSFAPAMLDLAETMIEEGDLQNAQTWLERAQLSNVPAIAQQASALLAKMRTSK
jgi:Tfp pilus assembly protein PilF